MPKQMLFHERRGEEVSCFVDACIPQKSKIFLNMDQIESIKIIKWLFVDVGLENKCLEIKLQER